MTYVTILRTSGSLRKEMLARLCHAGVQSMLMQSHATNGQTILAWQAMKESQRVVIDVPRVSGTTVAIRSASRFWTLRVSESFMQGTRRRLNLSTLALLQDSLL